LSHLAQKQTQIKTLGSALFWTSTQLLTVSSSIQNPISFSGRVLDVVMEIYAITVIAALAGALGAFLVKRGEEIDAAAKPTSRWTPANGSSGIPGSGPRTLARARRLPQPLRCDR
jgi:hypothetical protein